MQNGSNELRYVVKLRVNVMTARTMSVSAVRSSLRRRLLGRLDTIPIAKGPVTGEAGSLHNVTRCRLGENPNKHLSGAGDCAASNPGRD